MTKKRVQVDAFVIGAFMFVTAILIFVFPQLYREPLVLRNTCAVIGFVFIIIGALLRMSARGYKKHASMQSAALVTGGPYKLVRNPMYLGTFLVGVGFIFPLFPLWTIAIFSVVFYLRFIIEIKKEQKFLLASFGANYTEYCQRVPAFIPNLKSVLSVTFNEVFPWRHLWTTKEKYGLYFWPLLNIVIWFLQQEIFWHGYTMIPIIIDGVIVLLMLLWMITSVSEEE